ncbi:MAG TPA: AMP-binding protein [Gammaproteobacteria bacterium]|nr:AMP-binding protein [Gammaproteobacteria bacterium]
MAHPGRNGNVLDGESKVQRRSYFHRGGETALKGMTIPEHFSEIAARFEAREALVSIPQSRRLKYSELQMQADIVARALLADGFAKGSRVGIWSSNNVEWVLVQLATARIGAILVNVNPAYRTRELAHALERSEIEAVFLTPGFRSGDYVAMLQQLIPELTHANGEGFDSKRFPHLRRLVLFDPNKTASGAATVTDEGFLSWEEFLARAEKISIQRLEAESAALDPDDAINIQYTSGTTGFPKAVVLSHHNILNNAWFTAQSLCFDENDRLCIPVPFYHCFGMVLSNLLCFSVGACAIVPSEHFDPGAVLDCIERERCTAVHGVPTMFIAALEHPRFPDADLDSLRTGIMAGAPCPPELMRRVMEDMHVPEILIGYGETEASPLTHLTCASDSIERRVNTVGRNLPHQEVKVLDVESGATVPLGEDGEICFRGYHVMKGYYADAEATREAIDENGWLHSGDIGRMDGEGYLSITGRRKEMIIRGGENIYPREIEDFLFTHPKVAEVAVFGIPDEYYGEAVAAWIQPHAGERLSELEIREFCKGHIAHFKIPSHIEFVEEFPMTVTGKLQKFRMREIVIERMSKETSPSA